MGGRVIQGYFIGGRPLVVAAKPAVAQPAGQRVTLARPAPGPPPAFAGRAPAVQAKPAPGRPPLAHQTAGVVQPFVGGDSFEIDPMQIGLARGGGQPLPQAVLAKMEAAFGADFSGVRVHVGPQASRIGAVAFTMGDDVYFAPGKFQPDSPQGQQLIGHELAHVIQQRQGRVRARGAGVAVVQDPALEAEADRLGNQAAQGFVRPWRPAGGPATSLGNAAAIQPYWPLVVGAVGVAAAIGAWYTCGPGSARRAQAPARRYDLVTDRTTDIVRWLSDNDPGTQKSNFSVGRTERGIYIVSKVGGLGLRAGISTDLAARFPDVEIYLAPSYGGGGAASGSHGEMCVVAGANAATGRLQKVICTHPNCELCVVQLDHLGIGGGSIRAGAPGNQQTWVHPTEAAQFGTQFGASMPEVVAALRAFNAGRPIPRECGIAGGVRPTRGGAVKLT
ncbi:DUF4157 domain-containing protein [Phenylobacterium sp.]|uniref:eCIS core domain-containing protein n=1 Tax=Phenylobacterium sp. TaxID=1871053 RepID=UPI003D2C454C